MQMNSLLKTVFIGSLSTLLCACGGFFDKDNTPTPTALSSFKAEAHPRLLWKSSVNSGIANEYLKLVPVLVGNAIYTADKNGYVTATDKTTGRRIWQQSTGVPFTAGPAANDSYVFVGSRTGKVVALHANDGHKAWQSQVASEILAPPAVNNGVVLVKTIDGQLTALAENDGHVLWHYHQAEPTLILRGGSKPLINNSHAIVGFANGNLAKLSLEEGSLIWQQTVAIPNGSFVIQRMVDIDADPVIANNKVYAATYQGKIAALDFASSQILWSRTISSFTGIAVDSEDAFVSDATSQIWAFNAETGATIWQQKKLEARNVTGPAIQGNTVVIGDAEGYLHWLSKQDGHFVARTRIDSSGILATPIASNNIIYVLTKDGHLAAYSLT